MKHLPFFLVLLVLTACLPAPQMTLVPPETLAAQTMAAMPKTKTPLPSATNVPSQTPETPQGNPTPVLDLSLPGAYCLPANTNRTQAFVTRVFDAQTIEVIRNYETLRVRYLGLNGPKIAPPPPEWQAPQAVGYNANLVSGKTVTLIQDGTDTDSNGNLLRYVVAGNIFVNYEMIRQGYARYESMPPNIACDNSFIAAQVEAQGGIRGLWMATPVPTFTITPTPTITRTPVPVTNTPSGPCNCLGKKLSCKSFSSQGKAQRCFEYCANLGLGDIFGLDKNGNGLACDGLLP